MEKDEREAAAVIDSSLIEEGNRHTPAQQMKGQEGTRSQEGGGQENNTLQNEILLITAIKGNTGERSNKWGRCTCPVWAREPDPCRTPSHCQNYYSTSYRICATY